MEVECAAGEKKPSGAERRGARGESKSEAAE